MAAILLDVDGVFHVSGEPIAGGADAVRRLRANGHRIRFVTNNTTRSRATLAEELRAMGIELDNEELQTTPRAAAETLAGRRVLALTMHAIVGELEGIEHDRVQDRKSTRLNSSHVAISYAVFCLKKKKWLRLI